MPVDFHEIRFPPKIAYGSEGGPQFSTDIVTLASGYERRNQNWTYPREVWNVAYGVNDLASLQVLVEFFYARRGRAIGFRFQNPDDHEAIDQELAPAGGGETHFQLVKNYSSAGMLSGLEPSDGSEILSRKITKPVPDTVHVYVDSSEVAAEDFTVDYETGIVTFDTAPSSGEVVSATFDFDIPVRFDTDHLPLNLADYKARSATVNLVEIRV